MKSRIGVPIPRKRRMWGEDEEDLKLVRREQGEAEDRLSRMVNALRREVDLALVDVRRSIAKHAKVAGAAMLDAVASRIIEIRDDANARIAATNEQVATLKSEVAKHAETNRVLRSELVEVRKRLEAAAPKVRKSVEREQIIHRIGKPSIRVTTTTRETPEGTVKQ